MIVEPADQRAPTARWAIQMRWVGLLFAHSPVPAATLRPLIPAGLEVDEIDGSAWLGIVPFQMARVGPHGLALPGPLGNFGEINVRTYVTPTDPAAGPPGIWFLSLDAANPLVVIGARPSSTCPTTGHGSGSARTRTVPSRIAAGEPIAVPRRPRSAAGIGRSDPRPRRRPGRSSTGSRRGRALLG